ncbi:uncharacterized protein Z519_12740 [Cladophialophora bantiana CBS 173.52]|uniref:Uncharacterized protein n=1 Tax=Cladophialophora bantiana (strain ATCC 10958 / CBS 173.52 / CDC B-1940 / NIH 8579) TaxID=1442370 RepID=A0A0D2H732_CLAB1|nr:uncharacterized protein Z519_12740 [Cladophialophora bantiana CBS 173.52]KIW86685.1 hypothetical protein Z519_12740 [Cladophialophora bantiana CBS 173.52]
MGKSKKVSDSDAPPATTDEIHALFQGGDSTWESALKRHLGGIYNNYTIRNLADTVCQDSGEVSKEIGEIAALLVGEGKYCLTYYLAPEIQQRHTRRQNLICSNFFTEREEDLGRDDTIDMYKAFIPWAGPRDLVNVAMVPSGLTAMREILAESPDHRQDVHEPTSRNFYDLSTFGGSLERSVKDKIEGDNMRWWYRQPIKKRVAVGFEGMMMKEEDMKPWDVVNIDDKNLLTRLQQKEDQLENDFWKQLHAARKPVKAKNEGEDADDAATLVDF